MLLAAIRDQNEQVLITVLIQLVVIIAASRVFATAFRWLKQPAVVGEIAAGLVLGPSFFGHFWPELSRTIFDPAVSPIFGVLKELGLILLLFLVGMEFDFSHLKWHGKATLGISLTGIALPFMLGLGLAPIMHPHLELTASGAPVSLLGFTLFMGTAMSITAIPVLGRIMLELNITRTKIGAVTIAAAAIEDACGWIALAAISGIVSSQFQLGQTVAMVAQTVGFFLFMLLLARPVLRRIVRFCLRTNDGDIGVNGLAVILVVLFLCAVATSLIGIFAIFGAFILGTVLSEEHELREAMSRQLRHFLTVLFLPIFFTYTGLRTNIGTLESGTHWLFLLAVLGCAIFGKLGGCCLAAKLGGFPTREALCIGTMMNTRGLMELIVINVGKDLGVVTDSLFCMLVFMALITTVMTTPMLLWFMKGTELEPFVLSSGFIKSQTPMSNEIPNPKSQ